MPATDDSAQSTAGVEHSPTATWIFGAITAAIEAGVNMLTDRIGGSSRSLVTSLEQGVTMITERLSLSSRSISQTLQSEVSSLRSEIRTEFAAVRREQQKAARSILLEVQTQRQALEEERQQFADSKKLASERRWLVMLGNGRYICVHCDRHYHQPRCTDPNLRSNRYYADLHGAERAAEEASLESDEDSSDELINPF